MIGVAVAKWDLVVSIVFLALEVLVASLVIGLFAYHSYVSIVVFGENPDVVSPADEPNPESNACSQDK